MKIHTIRKPFLCRENQFGSGRTLCVGLDYQTLKHNESFWCYLGHNKKVHYEIKSSEALRVGQVWKNPKGKSVIIIPLENFKMVVSKWDRKKYEEKEIIRSIYIQLSLI